MLASLKLNIRIDCQLILLICLADEGKKLFLNLFVLVWGTTKDLECLSSGVTLYQGAPGSKFSKAPLVEVLKARVEHRICTSFLEGPGHVHPEYFWIYTLWNAISWTLGRDFTEFWWSENDIVTYQRPWSMFLLYRLNLGAPIWPIEVGGPRFLPVWAYSSYATVSKVVIWKVSRWYMIMHIICWCCGDFLKQSLACIHTPVT
jgi:hypothetical protein